MKSGRSARIGVLASGAGSNVQSLLDYFANAGRESGQIVWIGSNRPDAGALQRADRAGVPHGLIDDPDEASGPERQLAQFRALGIEVLVLAGYLKLVPPLVVTAYHGQMLNVHPSLLPAFGGEGMYGMRVHEAVLSHGARVSGVTVHFVDEHFDRGAIVAQWPVRVYASDTPDVLAARVLRAEHQLLPRAVAAVASGSVHLGSDGRVHGDVSLPDLPSIQS